VKIGDFCFLPQGTVVYPGVTVGDGVVARTGTHLSHDVPPFCHVVGMPGVIHKLLPIPAGLAEIVGPDRYRFYREEHRRLQRTMGLTYGNERQAPGRVPQEGEDGGGPNARRETAVAGARV
jgi:acyl-[acyl carrier protein]--UDP-N-acetylglucosamine O-acyltransferase